MSQSSIAFCENAECRVLVYDIDQTPAPEEIVAGTNCPGCGRFGRLKDDAGAERAAEVADASQEARKEAIVKQSQDVEQYFEESS